MNEEIWKPVVGFEEYYEVSNEGQVRRAVYSEPYYRAIPGKILVSKLDKKSKRSYPYVTLYGDTQHKKKHRLIHSLVLEAFVGKAPDGFVCNHIDGVRTNPKLSNLEWTTQSKNCLHAYAMGLSKGISNRYGAKLKDGEIWLIRKLLRHKVPHSRIAKMFRVCKSTVSFINNNKTNVGVGLLE